MEHIRLETIIALGSASLLAYVLWGPKTSKTRSADAGGALVGLQNVGNSCFVSAVLQAMASSVGVLAWLERPAPGQSPAHGRLRATLLRTLRVVNGAAGQQEAGSPAPLLACLQQLGWLIRRDEQDTHELFCLLVNTLLEATPPVSELAALASSAAQLDVDTPTAGVATGHHVASRAATPPEADHMENERCSSGLSHNAGPGSAKLAEKRCQRSGTAHGGAGEGDAVVGSTNSQRRDGATRHYGGVAMSGDTDGTPLGEDSLVRDGETPMKVNNQCNGNVTPEDSSGAIKLKRAGVKQNGTASAVPRDEHIPAMSPDSVHTNGQTDDITGRGRRLTTATSSDWAGSNREVGALASSLQTGAAGPSGACGPLPAATGRAGPNGEVGALASSLQTGAAGPSGACGPLPAASGRAGPNGEVGALASSLQTGVAGSSGACGSLPAASGRAGPNGEVGALASSMQTGAAGPSGACGPLPAASGSSGSLLRSTWPRATPAFPAADRGLLHRVPGAVEASPPGVGPARSPFCGTVSTQLTCLACGHKCAVRWETFASLSLPLPAVSPMQSLSLPALLARFSARETVHGVSCDHCRRRAAFCKRTLVAKLPSSLCLHLPRTTWRSDGHAGKRADHVAFFETLNMYPYTYAANAKAGVGPDAPPPLTDSGRHTYRLTAVIVHTGEADSGHFVTYRRAGDPADPRWFYTSDTLVSRATRSEVFASAAYMFFYERLATATIACHNR